MSIFEKLLNYRFQTILLNVKSKNVITLYKNIKLSFVQNVNYASALKFGQNFLNTAI